MGTVACLYGETKSGFLVVGHRDGLVHPVATRLTELLSSVQPHASHPGVAIPMAVTNNKPKKVHPPVTSRRWLPCGGAAGSATAKREGASCGGGGGLPGLISYVWISLWGHVPAMVVCALRCAWCACGWCNVVRGGLASPGRAGWCIPRHDVQGNHAAAAAAAAAAFRRRRPLPTGHAPPVGFIGPGSSHGGHCGNSGSGFGTKPSK
jgi:hypothetical protein